MILSDKQKQLLAELYAKREFEPTYYIVALICDEVLDKSGKLLGEIRDLAVEIREKNKIAQS